MHVLLLHVDLPESSYLLPDEFLASEYFENILAHHFPLECDLRAGKKAYCYRWLLDAREATSESVIELRRHQIVSDLCGS
jgi:hypothetical protein